MEVECALLDGEHDSELAQLQKEKESLEQLNGKIHSIDKTNRIEMNRVTLQTFNNITKQYCPFPSHSNQSDGRQAHIWGNEAFHLL